MTEKALRVIALAYKDVYDSCDINSIDCDGFPDLEKQNLVLIGLAGLRDPLREEVPEAVLK